MLKALVRGFCLLLGGCAPAIESPYQPQAADRNAAVNELIRQLFVDHGVAAELREGSVVFPEYASYELFAQVHESPDQSSRAVQLDVHLQIAPGRVLSESFAGLGTTRDDSIKDALQNFVVSTFHVLLAAFFVSDDAHVTVEEWVVNDVEYRVVIGNVSFRTMPSTEAISSTPWLESAKQELKLRSFDSAVHWVRIFYAQLNKETLELEVMVDNEPHEELRAAMTGYEWPDVGDYCSVRVFIVMLPRET